MKLSQVVYYARIFKFLILLMTLISCGLKKIYQKGTEPISHELWNQVLINYVDVSGKVNYQGLKEDPKILLDYLELLCTNRPNEELWDERELLAYWINLYNAFTIKLIIDHYPIKSIKNIGSRVQIPYLNSPWDIEFIDFGNEKMSLNYVEHQILRKFFEEPRIHFAINCASISCPNLRREAYVAFKIDAQLSDQTQKFLQDSSKNIITSNSLHLSKIFQWYSGDFNKNQTLYENLSIWSGVSINDLATKQFMDYNWSLNEQTRTLK